MSPEFETKDRSNELFFFFLAGVGLIALVLAAFKLDFRSNLTGLAFVVFVGSVLMMFARGWSDRNRRLRKRAERRQTLQGLHEAMNAND